jgi:hypothetical protein
MLIVEETNCVIFHHTHPDVYKGFSGLELILNPKKSDRLIHKGCRVSIPAYEIGPQILRPKSFLYISNVIPKGYKQVNRAKF